MQHLFYLQSFDTQAGLRRYRIHKDDDDANRQSEVGAQLLSFHHRPHAQVITFLTSDGIVRLPGRVLPHNSARLNQLRINLQQLPQPAEQGLCIGNVFTVAAMNACDPGRRVNLQGFCRSVDLVSEAVQDVVVRAGGEVITTQCNLKKYGLKHLSDNRLDTSCTRSGLHESLQMTVAIPYLFGVPPMYHHLSCAIEMGGGYVDRVVKEWRMTP